MFGLKPKEVVVLALTISLLFYFGYKKEIVALVVAYLLLLPVLFFVKKKKKLSYWQERFIVYLIALPIFSFVIPWKDLFALTVGSLIAGAIISASKSRKSGNGNK